MNVIFNAPNCQCTIHNHAQRRDYRSLCSCLVPLSLRHHLRTMKAPSKHKERDTITHLEQNVLVNSTREVENASSIQH